MKLSVKQAEIYDSIMSFFTETKDMAYVFSGVSGSGKSTITVEVYKELCRLGYNPVVLAYTGRAASVLISRGIKAQTIHSKIYKPVIKDGVILYWDKAEDIENDCIIVDEGSTVPEDIFEDLMSYGVPVLFVGDSEQLPPVMSTGFNVMDAYDVHLEEIHRVAEGNPLIQLSREIRETGKFSRSYNVPEIQIINRRELNRSAYKAINPDIAIVGTNKTRKLITQLARASRGYYGMYPEPNERVMCLTNSISTNHVNIYNGELFTVKDVQEFSGGENPFAIYKLRRDGEYDKEITVQVYEDCWLTEEAPNRDSNFHHFTYGNAATCFKLQGSEFNHPLVIREDVSYFVDQRRYDYTAVTRAKDRITIAV